AVQIRSSRICRTRVGSSTHPLRQPRKKPLSGLFLRLAERVGCVRLIPEPHPPRCALRASHSAVQIRSSRICRTRVGSSTHPLRQPRKKRLSGLFLRLAERVGFEPTVRYKRTPDFESGTFDHSATSPEVGRE